MWVRARETERRLKADTREKIACESPHRFPCITTPPPTSSTLPKEPSRPFPAFSSLHVWVCGGFGVTVTSPMILHHSNLNKFLFLYFLSTTSSSSSSLPSSLPNSTCGRFTMTVTWIWKRPSFLVYLFIFPSIILSFHFFHFFLSFFLSFTITTPSLITNNNTVLPSPSPPSLIYRSGDRTKKIEKWLLWVWGSVWTARGRRRQCGAILRCWDSIHLRDGDTPLAVLMAFFTFLGYSYYDVLFWGFYKISLFRTVIEFIIGIAGLLWRTPFQRCAEARSGNDDMVNTCHHRSKTGHPWQPQHGSCRTEDGGIRWDKWVQEG